jgi:hypothetical protein
LFERTTEAFEGEREREKEDGFGFHKEAMLWHVLDSVCEAHIFEEGDAKGRATRCSNVQIEQRRRRNEKGKGVSTPLCLCVVDVKTLKDCLMPCTDDTLCRRE